MQPKILVVDDEEPNLDLVSRRLGRTGYDVRTAISGPRALELLERTPIDLVLLDHMMPGMSGLEVLREIRKESSREQLPVIIVTALSESCRIAEALDLGANDYLTKPVDFPVALARIRVQLAHRRADAELRTGQERYVLAARGAGAGVWDWDLADDTVYCSPECHAILGSTATGQRCSSAQWLSRVVPEDRAIVTAAMKEADRHAGEPAASSAGVEVRMAAAGGERLWVELHGVSLCGADGAPTRRVGTMADVTGRKTMDPLTGLRNRLGLSEEIAAALHRRKPGGALAVLSLIVDRFKLIQEGLGPESSDLLLLEIGARMESACRAAAAGRNWVHWPARIAVDEFALLLEGFESEADAVHVGEALLEAMKPAFQVGQRELSCFVSIGLVVSRDGSARPEGILEDAATAMRVSNSQARNRLAVFEPAMRLLRDRRIALDMDLRQALDHGQLEVFYQPRVHLDSALICGFEALVRWNHPTLGRISPLEFIPLAEENGMIHRIGLWVLRQACLQMQQWRKRYPLGKDFDIAVNLSASQCREPGLVEQVEQVLESTELPPANLHLELTESLLLENVEASKTVLQSLKSLGIGLKIDDFGTGYSCLKYLCEFPFDSLKIDRSFTLNLDQHDSDTEEIIRTILQMARNLRMQVIAEGIESQRHITRLRELGCEFGQGYFFARPISAEETEGLLRAQFESAPPVRQEDAR